MGKGMCISLPWGGEGSEGKEGWDEEARERNGGKGEERGEKRGRERGKGKGERRRVGIERRGREIMGREKEGGK